VFREAGTVLALDLTLSSDSSELVVVLPEDLDGAAGLLELVKFRVLHFLKEFKVLDGGIIKVLLGVGQVRFDTFHCLEDVGEITELLVWYLVFREPTLSFQVL
jgi:hypothetical protein